MQQSEAGKLVAVILAAYPTQARTIDGERAALMVEVWRELLDDIPYSVASTALRGLLQSTKWMPSIAEVREAVLELERGPQRPGGDAWGDVLRAVSVFGYYRSPAFDDPLVEQCVHALGWRTICVSDETDPSTRARFIDLYDRKAGTMRREQQAPILAAARDARITSAGSRILTELAGVLVRGKRDE